VAKAWPNGCVRGLRARSGFEVNIEWKDGVLELVEIKSLLGNRLKLRYGSKVIETKTNKGQVYHYDGKLKMH